MRCLAPQVLVVLLVGGSACCTPPKPLPNAVNATAYVCQWSNIEVTQGLSVVTDGDPSNKSVEELYKISPMGVVTSFCNGLIHSAIFSLTAVYAIKMGFSILW